GGGELDVIVLAGALNEYAELHRVIANNLCRVVGPGVHETRPDAWIRTIAYSRQAIDGDIRQLVAVPLRAGENEWIGDAGGAAATARTARRVRVDGAHSVGVGREGELVDKRR